MAEKEKFYITTPIYYSSGDLHLGHCCTSVYADSLARWNRMLNKDVFFLTGSDEHGQKVAEKASEAGITPQQYCDNYVKKYYELWKKLNISYDKYIRTTDDYHVSAVQKIFKKLYDNGDIYLSSYEGWYCTPCESFWTESQLKDGKCPDCGREVKKSKEEAYFFKLSKYADRVKQYILSHPDFVKLEGTKNEMISFIDQGLNDLCVSRTSVKWGIPVPFNKNHTIYVWIDALPNYLTALGYLSDDDSLFKKYWPANVQLMAKEIARFHIIIWPAILMALGLPLPKTIHAHGWLTNAGKKMGKSLGNGFNPYILCDRYGVDAVRYFLLRYGPILGDAPYDNDSFLKAINTDLVNDLANLLSRTTAMMVQNFDGKLAPLSKDVKEIDNNLISETVALKQKVSTLMEKLEVNNALAEIFKVIRLANKYIEDTAPWTLKEDKTRLGDVLHNLYFVLHSVAVLLEAFIPETAQNVLKALDSTDTGLDTISETYNKRIAGAVVKKTALYQRLNIEKEKQYLEVDSIKQKEEPAKVEHKPYVEFEDFEKLEIKVGKILTAEKVENADKLLKFSVEFGSEIRTIVSGVALHYDPAYMVGKQVLCVMNLKPRKIRGVESQGMILYAFANGDKEFCFVTPEKEISSGADVGWWLLTPIVI